MHVSSKVLLHRGGFASLYMASNEIHDPQVHSTPILDIANGIHDPTMIFLIGLTRVAANKGLERGLGLHLILTCLLLLIFLMKLDGIVRPENGGWLLNHADNS